MKSHINDALLDPDRVVSPAAMRLVYRHDLHWFVLLDMKLIQEVLESPS